MSTSCATAVSQRYCSWSASISTFFATHSSIGLVRTSDVAARAGSHSLSPARPCLPSQVAA